MSWRRLSRVGYSFHKRTWLVSSCLAGIIAGLWLADAGIYFGLELLIIGLIISAVSIRKPRIAIFSLLFIGLFFGSIRGQIFSMDIARWSDYYGQEVTLVGVASSDDYFQDGQTELIVDSVDLVDSHGAKVKLSGRAKVSGFGALDISRGDIVSVSGKILPTLGNYQGRMRYSDIEVHGRKQSIIGSIRSNFITGVYNSISDPAASLGIGFLVGQKVLLPDSLLNQLSVTGLTHIVAVSGYNLTIMVRLMKRLFARNSKFLATAGALGLIIGFIAVTGFSPSIARASVVSLLSIAAWYYGRDLKPSVIILFSAALTAFINPTYLWYDLGWYLSFLAFIGVLMLAPYLSKRLYRDSQPGAISQILIETFSAQIMVLPIIAYTFGTVSLISLLANLAVLPMIPVAMLLTFVSGVAGWVIPTLASWISWPAQIVLNSIVQLVVWFAEFPWASVEIKFSIVDMWLLYLSIASLTAIIRLKVGKLAKINVVD